MYLQFFINLFLKIKFRIHLFYICYYYFIKDINELFNVLIEFIYYLNKILLIIISYMLYTPF